MEGQPSLGLLMKFFLRLNKDSCLAVGEDESAVQVFLLATPVTV